MPDVKVFLRVGNGRNGYKSAASMKSNPAPLTETRDGTERPIPTVEFKLILGMSPTAFNAAEIEIPLDDELLKEKLLASYEASAS
jgi:hypothetical protein